jgi:hypothetical protein
LNCSESNDAKTARTSQSGRPGNIRRTKAKHSVTETTCTASHASIIAVWESPVTVINATNSSVMRGGIQAVGPERDGNGSE